MKLPELGSTWVDKSDKKYSKGNKVVVFNSNIAVVEYTYTIDNHKSNRSIANFYRDFRPYDEKYDSPINFEEEITRRYFYVTYSIKGGFGAVSVMTEGMLNHESIKADLKRLNPNLENIFITNFIEMSEQDYEDFNRKESDDE